MDPRLFASFQRVTVIALQSSGNDKSLRDALAAMSLEMRLQAIARHGFVTADSEVLSDLLRKTDPNRKPEGAVVKPRDADVFEYLSKILSGDHYSAACTMREVWASFGRFLTTATRGFEKGSGMKRASVAQPLDVMRDEVWETYRDFFKPWISAASRRVTPRKRGGGNILNSEIVHRIIVMECFPAHVDGLMDIAPGAALKTLRFELGKLYGGEVAIPEDNVRAYVAPDTSPAEEPARAAA